MVSVAILNTQKIFDDLDSGRFNDWNATSYVQDGPLLGRLTESLHAEIQSGPTPVFPAVLAWAFIIFRLAHHARSVEEARNRQLESAAPGSRTSLPALSQLEEAVLHIAQYDTSETPVFAMLASGCLNQGVFDVMENLLRVGMTELGSSVDRVSRDKFRLLYMQVIRAAMSADAIDFSHDGLVHFAHQILVGERTAHNWSALDAPRHIDDPVVTFVREDHAVLRDRLLLSLIHI